MTQTTPDDLADKKHLLPESTKTKVDFSLKGEKPHDSQESKSEQSGMVAGTNRPNLQPIRVIGHGAFGK